MFGFNSVRRAFSRLAAAVDGLAEIVEQARDRARTELPEPERLTGPEDELHAGNGRRRVKATE